MSFKFTWGKNAKKVLNKIFGIFIYIFFSFKSKQIQNQKVYFFVSFTLLYENLAQRVEFSCKSIEI